MAAAAVTGTERIVSNVSDGTVTTDGDTTLTDGVQFVNRWEASDPRLTGDVAYTGKWLWNEPQQVQVEANHRVLENDGGRWVGSGNAILGPTIGNVDTVLLTGEGGYEGLTAYVIIDWGNGPGNVRGCHHPWRDADAAGAGR